MKISVAWHFDVTPKIHHPIDVFSTCLFLAINQKNYRKYKYKILKSIVTNKKKLSCQLDMM